ncbi:nickel-dependent hydrogenase large subunit [Alteromonas mediterranea]|uniref:nickel-dependent hydrogenase large subunit n=1 Tax=Alteromonas mediterranea TaxID=314275 RepID=UPI002FE25F15
MKKTEKERLVVDPITRIEGHLRIEAEMDGNTIKRAYSSGTSVRGIELILQGRDPRDAWAFAQRICGVCTLVHGMASVRSVENTIKKAWLSNAKLGVNAGFPELTSMPKGPMRHGMKGHKGRASAAKIPDKMDIEIPQNAQLIRNIMIATQYVHDHVMHFYHLHALDWVDVVSALDADPVKTASLAGTLSAYPRSSPGYFKDMKAKVKRLVESGQLGIFSNAYWGHPGYKLPAEVNLMALAHYLDALEWQRDVVKVHTIFGGKNPHPNFVVGGVPSPINLDASTGINTQRLVQLQDAISQMKMFVDEVYFPDILAIGGYYKDWSLRGEGLGNFLTYGDLPMTSMDEPGSFLFPRGAILGRDLKTIYDVDLDEPSEIQEFVSSSWYRYKDGNKNGLHPFEGETELEYTGPTPPYKHLDTQAEYSWLKSPRWKGHAMEVGPLARVLMMYAKKNAMAEEIVNSSLSLLKLEEGALFSTLGRTLARAVETKIVVNQLQIWYDALLDNIAKGNTTTFNPLYFDPQNWPIKGQGVGVMEAPRGALGHWMVMHNGSISNYQCVVPTTWNAGPRDPDLKAGAYESALQDKHTLHDPDQPLEILRTLHSFDPCLACAVHVLDAQGEERL